MAAISTDLQLAAAAGNTTDFNLQSFFAGLTGVTASIAGVAAPEISAGLWVASEVLSMLPSASSTANSSFQTTYDGLLNKMATARSEMAQQLISQSQQVRIDQGLLGLVGQLRSQGTWVPNIDGIESTSRMAFVLETYKALAPTVFDRYRVTNCANVSRVQFCTGPSPGPGVIGNRQNFTTIGLPPTTSLGMPATPCIYHENTGSYYCHYETNAPSADLMTRIWGPMTSICNYQPGNAGTAWTFGCNLGVPVATSIGTSPDWAFATHTGNPVTMSATSSRGAVRATAGVVRASAARAGSSARAARNLLAPLRFRGRVFFPRGLRLRRMRVSVQRTLFEHGRREELARSGSGRRLRPFALRRVRAGVFTSGRRGGPRVRLVCGVRGAGRRAAWPTPDRGPTRDIRALCTILPASVSRAAGRWSSRPPAAARPCGDTGRHHARALALRARPQGRVDGIRPIKPRRSRTARPVAGHDRAARAGVRAPRERADHGRQPAPGASSPRGFSLSGTCGSRHRRRPGTDRRLKELRARRSRTVRLTPSRCRAAPADACP